MKKWMSNLNNDNKWTSINIIPSTHNSGAIHPLKKYKCIQWFWAKCQNHSIKSQLNMGVRGLDIRLTIDDDKIYVSHTFISEITYYDVLATIKDFLTENPSEFIFLFIKPDWPTKNKWDNNNVSLLWENTYNFNQKYKPETNIFIKNKNINLQNINIKDIRGKLIIIPDGKFSPSTNDQSFIRFAILPFNIFKVCETWNKCNFSDGKSTIIRFIEKNCKANNEKKTMYNIIQFNIVINPLPPYFISKCMNDWLQSILSVFKLYKLGFISIDFANIDIIESLVQHVLCTND